MDKITGKGWIAGAVAWLSIMWYATTQNACLKTNSCDGEDLFIFALIGLGMLGPSYLVALFFSNLKGK